jgi:hypothetical protein
MRNASQYIADAQRRAANSKTLNFVGEPSNLGFAAQPGFNASGDGGSVKKSQPYAILVSSASGAAVQNFDVLGAFEYINNSGFNSAGSLVVGSITISSAIPGVSYRELLYQSMNNPFTVGLTYLSCSSPVAQVNEIFTITTKDANGTSLSIPIVPSIDPYQQQQGINVVQQEYRIDGFTKLTFANILANAVLTIRLFPADNLNPARALSGAATTKSYGNPGVIR